MSESIQVSDLEIIWEDGNSNGLFSEIGFEYSDAERKSKDVKLDVLFTFKKTTLSALVNYLLTSAEGLTNNRFLNETIGLVKCIVLYAIAPKNAEVYFSDENEFRGVLSRFKKEFGEYYVTEESLSDIPGSEIMMNRLITKKLLEKDGNRYYIVGHIMKNIEINKTNKTINADIKKLR